MENNTTLASNTQKTMENNQQPPDDQAHIFGSTPTDTHAKSKKYNKFLLPLVLLAVVVAGYFLYSLITQPTTEEVALNAIKKLELNDSLYHIDVQLGRASNNYSITHDNSGNVKVVSNDNTFLKTHSGAFIKLSSEDDSAADFMKDVLMLGTPNSKNMNKLQNKWVEVGTYLGSNPALPNFTPPEKFSFDDVSIARAIEKEAQNDTYITGTASMNPSELYDLLAMLDGKIGYRIFTSHLSKADFTKEEISADIKLTPEQKLEKVNTNDFAGRLLSIHLSHPASGSVSTDLQSIPLPELVDYSFISDTVFNDDLQAADSKDDQERIADIKAMKTAFDIYEHRTGEVKSYFGFDQEEFIANRMPGADEELFTDPEGNIIGRNGGSYAYAGEAEGDDSRCGGTVYDFDLGEIELPPCEKFFIITTLSTGQDFQLNSGIY